MQTTGQSHGEQAYDFGPVVCIFTTNGPFATLTLVSAIIIVITTVSVMFQIS